MLGQQVLHSLGMHSVLWAVLVLIVGMLLRLNTLLVSLTAALAAAVLSGLGTLQILQLLGSEARDKRFLLLLLLILPLVSVLESLGLREYLKRAFSARANATLAKVLSGYFLLRQVAAAVGLTSIGGHAHSVRPLLVPLAEAAALKRFGILKESAAVKLRAFCAGTDNVALFFGEDVFLAFGAVLLMQSVLLDLGVKADALALSLWAIPTALIAMLVHLVRIRRFNPTR